MTYRRFFVRSSIGLSLLLLVGLVAGCHKGGPNAALAGASAFQSAPPELKAAWETAAAADRTNGYAVAYGTLMRMRHPAALTPEQLQAVNGLLDSVTTRLLEALKKGDPEAKKASAEIAHMDKGAER